MHCCVQGTWVWTDGTAWNYTNWKPGQPDEGTAANCMLMGTDQLWYDLNTCAQTRYYVCKL